MRISDWSSDVCSSDLLACRLRQAYAGTPVAPLRDGLESLDGSNAYRVQAINTEFWLSEGRRISGRKIGLTAKAVQTQLGVDQPDFGVLFADMAIEDGGLLSRSEEHTSELQSLMRISYAVFCLKKKK